jgi:acyl dehydratase
MAFRWYEDFEIGQEIVSAGKTLTESDIVQWAFTYDPQPFHMDRERARESLYGGLIASGWQVGSTAFRLFMDTAPFADGASLGSPGVDNLRWVHPVRPDDTIRVHVSVTEKRPSKSKPDRGIVNLNWQVKNQDGVTVMTMQSIQLIARRDRSS